jgi:hypothetical protein
VTDDLIADSRGRYADVIDDPWTTPRDIEATDQKENLPCPKIDYDGGGLAKGGSVSLYYDGEKVGEGRVERAQPFDFSGDEGLAVAREIGTAVAPECDVESSEFTGEINWVELKVGDDDHGHMVDPEELLHVVMARQ